MPEVKFILKNDLHVLEDKIQPLWVGHSTDACQV